jgi:hypothetical protein
MRDHLPIDASALLRLASLSRCSLSNKGMNMARLLHLASIRTMLVLIGLSTGCTRRVEVSPGGGIQIRALATPGAIASIHVAVTGSGLSGSIDADLVQQPDQSWTGSVNDVPPGTDLTVTAEAFDAQARNIFEGVANNVQVVAGAMTDVTLTLRPVGSATETGVNTAPHFVTLQYPQSALSNAPVSFSATADDPDAATRLTYTWSVIQGGGSFAPEVISDQDPSEAVSTVYTPVVGFVGFVVVQVSAGDGTATTSTSFPLAIGGGLNTHVVFATPPDTTITGVQRQSLMPGGSTQVDYALTNPNQPWTPASMHVQTSWSDSCGGTFDQAPEDLDINKGDTVTRSVTYTASPVMPVTATGCQLTLTVSDPNNVQASIVVNVWVDPPMVIFMSSASVAGNAFQGKYQLADAFCQSLADAPTALTPPGTYRALISFDTISAKDRLVDTPFIRVDGTPIARNKAELYGINQLNAIRVNEKNEFTGVSAVYTGTNGDGSKGTNCLNWTSNDGADTSTAGINATDTHPNWTNSGTFTCSAQLPIYCVQQPS